MDAPKKTMTIRLTTDQTEQLLAWSGEIVRDHVEGECEPPGYQLVVDVTPFGHEAAARCGSLELELGDVVVEILSN